MIKIPIFSNDPSNKNICEYLIHNYRNIIVYCNSQKEGIAINIILNTLQKGCSMYIDCHTKKKDRNDIINKYKNGDIPFLVNVRILVEGFDAPITKGVMFMHLPSSKTTLIQIIGRALRLNPLKTIANIILPFSSKEDEKNINNFMKIMAKNDRRIKQSFENKILGGYINIECHNIEDNDDIKFRYEMIYNNMGILQNGEEIWMKRLQEVKDYIDEHKKTPSQHDRIKDVRNMGTWIKNQRQSYKHKRYCMKFNTICYNKWKEFTITYKEYFKSNEEIWLYTYNKVIEYIINNQNIPSTTSKNKDNAILRRWIDTQRRTYNKKICIMKNNNIYNIWTTFTQQYSQYYPSNNVDIWLYNLEQVKTYININKQRPPSKDNNKDIARLGKWIGTALNNYRKKDDIMKNNDIYNKWEEFINNYKVFFQTDEDLWYNSLNKVIKYIETNNCVPSTIDKKMILLY